jgi:hypothetical protein
MTKDDILRMAREAWSRDEDFWLTHEQVFLERFAALVAAQEREACAKVAKETVCDMHLGTGIKIYGTKAAAAIRARVQA